MHLFTRLGARVWVRVFVVCAVLFVGLAGSLPAALGESICGPDGTQGSGAVYRVCLPADGSWNGDLVVYAHGYVAYNQPIAIPEDQLTIPGGPSLPQMVNDLGYAFAATSYAQNGLAIQQGVQDLVDLVEVFGQLYGEPQHVYLVGVSEGGLITALAVEQYPDVFDGGLAACGPVGDFVRQINYWGDVRVVFDYFFPGVIPGKAMSIPQSVIDNWPVYEAACRAALQRSPSKTAQLVRVANVPVDVSDPATYVDAVMQVLWYNVWATNDGRSKLGGQPYDNSKRVYRGSTNDTLLNRRVARYKAEPVALAAIAAYQASGDLSTPMVTLHTMADPAVPYWHEPLYSAKIARHGDEALHIGIPIVRYGHCAFTSTEALVAFAALVLRVTGNELVDAERVLWSDAARAEYRALRGK